MKRPLFYSFKPSFDIKFSASCRSITSLHLLLPRLSKSRFEGQIFFTWLVYEACFLSPPTLAKLRRAKLLSTMFVRVETIELNPIHSNVDRLWS